MTLVVIISFLRVSIENINAQKSFSRSTEVKKLNAICLSKIVALIITLNIMLAISPIQTLAQQVDVSFQIFYDRLNPYGQWIEDPNHGYVWIPSAGSNFVPYLSNGYWLLTDYGWMWISDYDWGWAPFHYGRWDYSNYYGWFWVPDSEWGPSWVTWRRSEGYFGWAPMRPGVSISITFSNYYDLPFDRWVFVRDRDIERRDIGRNYIDRRNNRQLINNSTVINKTFYDDKRRSTYITGPERDDVQKVTGKTIKPVAVRERDKPGQTLNNDQLQIYRPQVEKNDGRNKHAPTDLSKLRDVKRNTERAIKTKPENIQTPRNVKDPQPQPDKADMRNRDYQFKKSENPQKEIKKEQPADIRKINPPSDNRNNGVVTPVRNVERPKTEYKEVRAAKPENIPAPRVNNNTNQQPKTRAVTPPRNNNKEQPDRTNPNDDKKDKRK